MNSLGIKPKLLIFEKNENFNLKVSPISLDEFYYKYTSKTTQRTFILNFDYYYKYTKCNKG